MSVLAGPGGGKAHGTSVLRRCESGGCGDEFVAAAGGAEPPYGPVEFEVGSAAHSSSSARGDGHVAHGVGGEGVELAQRAVFEPQDPVGNFVEAVVVGDNDHGAVVVVGERA